MRVGQLKFWCNIQLFLLGYWLGWLVSSPDLAFVFEDGLADGPGMWASIVDGKEQPLACGTSCIFLSLAD